MIERFCFCQLCRMMIRQLGAWASTTVLKKASVWIFPEYKFSLAHSRLLSLPIFSDNGILLCIFIWGTENE